MGEIIIKDANEIFGCDLMENNRKRQNVDGRSAVCHYMRNTYGFRFQKIADFFNKSVWSIMHTVKLHEDLYKYNVDYRIKYDKLIEKHNISKLICNTCVYPFNIN